MGAPTIRDVARRAGVGVATVSRVLNGSERVTEETRQKVLDAIRELNFTPNTVARQLSIGKTFTIGVATPFFTYPSFVERIAGIQEALDTSEYTLVLYSVRTLEQLQWQFRELATQKRVDGLIVLSLPFPAEEIKRSAPDFPVVAVDNDPQPHYPYLIIDDIKGGRLATNYLIDRGHRKIGFIGDHIEKPISFTSTRRRLEGFTQALHKAGLLYNPDWVWYGEHSREAAREYARRILSLPDRPTAIFASIDTLAFGVLAAAGDLGLRVPDDVAVIGFDDIQAADIMNMTTVRQHLFESGRMSAEYMLEWLRGGLLTSEQWRTIMPLEVVERATT